MSRWGMGGRGGWKGDLAYSSQHTKLKKTEAPFSPSDLNIWD